MGGKINIDKFFEDRKSLPLKDMLSEVKILKEKLLKTHTEHETFLILNNSNQFRKWANENANEIFIMINTKNKIKDILSKSKDENYHEKMKEVVK